jgi:prepilin-type processing-associated H-X9-DG protein
MLEMLVTVAIILILTTMYWGSNSGARQRLQNGCQQNLQKLYVALQIYGNDQSGKFPVVPTARSSEDALDVLVPRYDSDTSIFLCPASGLSPLPPGESIAKHKIGYAYYMGRSAADSSEALMSDGQVDTLAKTPGQLIFSDTGKPPGNNHKKYGGNLLFCDGHTEWIQAHVPISLSLTQGVVLLNPRP